MILTQEHLSHQSEETNASPAAQNVCDHAAYIRCLCADISIECFKDGAIVSLSIAGTYCVPAAASKAFPECTAAPLCCGLPSSASSTSSPLDSLNTGLDTVKLVLPRYEHLTTEFRRLLDGMIRLNREFAWRTYRAGVNFQGYPVRWRYDRKAKAYRMRTWISIPEGKNGSLGKILICTHKNSKHKAAPDVVIQFSRKLFPTWHALLEFLSSVVLRPESNLLLRRLDLCADIPGDLQAFRLRVCVKRQRLPPGLESHYEDGFYLSLQGNRANRNFERYVLYRKGKGTIRSEGRFHGSKLARVFSGVDPRNIRLGDLPGLLLRCRNFFPGLLWLAPTGFPDVERRRRIEFGGAQRAMEWMREKHERATRAWAKIHQDSAAFQRRLTAIVLEHLRLFFGVAGPVAAHGAVHRSGTLSTSIAFITMPMSLRPTLALRTRNAYLGRGPPRLIVVPSWFV